MTRIWVMSDLHDDANRAAAGNYALPRDVEADVMVIAGDIAGRLSRMGRSFLEAQDRGIPIIVVPGNHDYWRGSLEQEVQRFRDRAKSDFVHILDAQTIVVAGTRFIGATLWTDFLAFHGDLGRAQHEAVQWMNDYRFIRTDSYEKRLRPAHLAGLHAAHRGFIEAELEKPFAVPTVVVTHHAPSPRSLYGGRADAPLDASYASDLEPLIRQHQPDLWIHGHVHSARDYMIGATHIVCNPRGYVHAVGMGKHRRIESENAGFNPRMVVEVGLRPSPDETADELPDDADRRAVDAAADRIRTLKRDLLAYYVRPGWCGLEMSRAVAEERALRHAMSAWKYRAAPLVYDLDDRDAKDLDLEMRARAYLGLTKIAEEELQAQAAGPLKIERMAREMVAKSEGGDLDDEAFEDLRCSADWFQDDPDPSATPGM